MPRLVLALVVCIFLAAAHPGHSTQRGPSPPAAGLEQSASVPTDRSAGTPLLVVGPEYGQAVASAPRQLRLPQRGAFAPGEVAGGGLPAATQSGDPERVNEQANEQANEQVNEQANGQVNGQVNEQVNEQVIEEAQVLYLTFDDGPHPRWTTQILELLARYEARATFFVVGQAVEAHPGLVGETHGSGHRVANHTHTHPAASSVSREVFAADVARADAAIEGVTGTPSPCLRPPYGSAPARAGEATGKEVVLWDVDPRDWERPGVDVIVERVRSQMRPGAIILLHDGGGDRSQTVEALATLLPEWRAAGYVFGLLCPLDPPRLG